MTDPRLSPSRVAELRRMATALPATNGALAMAVRQVADGDVRSRVLDQRSAVMMLDELDSFIVQITELRNALSETLDEVEALRADKTRLQGVIEHDRTRFGLWTSRIRAEIAKRRGISQSRGSYQWDDEEYFKEFGAALNAIGSAVDRLHAECRVADFTDCPTTQDGVEAARATSAASPLPGATT